MKRPDRREQSTPMTHAERVAEIKGRFGFTERQAGFLVTVMLHAGVCLARQYCAFARIKYGEPMRTFFQTLEARRFVTPQTCAHGRARLFHVHYKPLYTAIGEPDNRFRRPMTLARGELWGVRRRRSLLDGRRLVPPGQWRQIRHPLSVSCEVARYRAADCPCQRRRTAAPPRAEFVSAYPSSSRKRRHGEND
jgi:hypothetical protein